MQRLMQAAARACAAAMTLVLLGGLFALPAGAHAHLTRSTPSDGQVLTSEPATVSAVYGEETSLTGTRFEVYYAKDGTSGQVRADNGDGHVDVNVRTNVSATLKPGLGDGVYTVKWHTLTENDNGQVDGSFSFTVAGGRQATGATGKTGTQQEQPAATPASTNGSGQPLPSTGNPSDTLALAALGALVILSGGLALRRAARR